MLFPSQVVSDQFASQVIVTKDGRTLTGMIGSAGNNAVIVLQSNGDKIRLEEDEIESHERSKISAMPDGLLNTLTIEQVADLFAYLTKSPTDLQLSKRPSAKPE